MVKYCAAINCNNQNLNGKKCGYYIFPTDPDRREEWIYACRRVNADGSKWNPGIYTYLCGEHFISGKPNPNVMNQDYIPSIFNFPTDLQESESERIYRSERLAKRKIVMQEKAERMKRVKEEEKNIPKRTVVKRPFIYDHKLKKECENGNQEVENGSQEVKQESVCDPSQSEQLKTEDSSVDPEEKPEAEEPDENPGFLTEYFLPKQPVFRPYFTGPRIKSVFITDASDVQIKEKPAGEPTPVFLVKNLAAEVEENSSVEPRAHDSFHEDSSDDDY